MIVIIAAEIAKTVTATSTLINKAATTSLLYTQVNQDKAAASQRALATVNQRVTASHTAPSRAIPTLQVTTTKMKITILAAATEAVAVADEAVAEDCDAPIGNVADETVLGEAVTDDPPTRVRIGRSPPLGPVPLYDSAKIV